jgi:hypothetical protein
VAAPDEGIRSTPLTGVGRPSAPAFGVVRSGIVGFGLVAGFVAIVAVTGNFLSGAAATPAPSGSALAVQTHMPLAPASAVGAGVSPRINEIPGATGSSVPTPGPISPATISFSGIGLDAGNDADATGRTFQFVSDGAGSVVMSVTKISAGGTAKLCIQVDAGAFACQVGYPGKLPNFPHGTSAPGHNTWTATLIGYGTSKPTVDVTFTWPTASPKVTLSHGRFQGSSSPGIAESLNGFTATFQPRAGGQVNVQATWTVITTDASMTLQDDTTPPPVTVDQRAYKAVTYINPAFSANVEAGKTYVVMLRNSSPDSQGPDLTAQIEWP